MIVRVGVDCGNSKSDDQSGDEQFIPKSFHGFLQVKGVEGLLVFTSVLPSLLFQLSLEKIPDTKWESNC